MRSCAFSLMICSDLIKICGVVQVHVCLAAQLPGFL